MMAAPALDWRRVRAVVFDLDGTLYDQRSLRLRVARDLLVHCLPRPGGLGTLRILRAFRLVRPQLAEEEAPSIARLQYERTAELLRVDPAAVETAVGEWIFERPLPHQAACRRPGAQSPSTAARLATALVSASSAVRCSCTRWISPATTS